MADAHIERLLRELEERANAEIAQVESDATARVANIRAEAEARGEADAQRAVAACENEHRRARAVAVADAQRAARGDLLMAQHAFVDRVVARARALVRERLGDRSAEPKLAEREALLRAYAVTSDVRVERGPDGLTLAADAGHIAIRDDVESWLARERAAIAIDACRSLEQESA